MAAIYYADDEQDIRELVSAWLKSDGHEVTAFETGDALLTAFRERPCDLVILDIMMPGTDGIGILTALSGEARVPLIMLTPKDTDSDYYTGLTLGSDDYITKPFKPMLLSARVKALLRRVEMDSGAPGRSAPVITCGNLRYTPGKNLFEVSGRELRLTPTELKYLAHMMAHLGENVSRNDLLDAVWGMNFEVETRVVDETNRRLRRKLNEAGADVTLETVWGFGFKLTERNA